MMKSVITGLRGVRCLHAHVCKPLLVSCMLCVLHSAQCVLYAVHAHMSMNVVYVH